MEICFVRHTTVSVPEGTCYGWSDVALADTFESEARNIRDRIAGHSFDRVFCSPLNRCVRLAEFCGFGDAQRDDRLKELHFGDWELQRWDEIDDPQLQRWYDNWIEVAPTGGESFLQLYDRVTSFLQEQQAKGTKSLLLFTHSGVLHAARVFFGETTFQTVLERQLPYGAMLHFRMI